MSKKMIKSLLSTAVASVVAISSTICCFADETNTFSAAKAIPNVLNILDGVSSENDFGYKGNLNITFGQDISDMLGVEIKPIDIEGKINSKSGNADVDLSVKYNENKLATVNALYEGETGKMYFKVPELNDAYISGTMEELEELIISYIYGDIEDSDDLEDIVGSEDIETGDIDFEALEDIDLAELENHILEYVSFVVGMLPSAVPGEKIDGHIDGHGYSFDTKSLEINGKNIYDITKAVLEKAKNDSYLKELAASLGVNETSYEETIDLYLDLNEDATVAELGTKYNIMLYYDDESITGIKITQDDLEVFRFILMYTEDVIALDVYSYYENMEEETTIYGSCVPSYGKLSGNFKKTTTDGEYYEDITTVTLTDLGLDAGVLQGGIKIENSIRWFDDDEGTQTVYDFVSNSTTLKDDLTLKISVDGSEIVTLNFTGEEFEPEEVVFPTEKVYSFADSTELMKYVSNCDIEGFLDNAKSVLGDELYTIIEEIFAEGDDDKQDGDNSFIDENSSLIDDSDNSSSVVDATSKSDNNKANVNTNKTVGKDNSANTGVASGAAAITLMLVGVAIVINKRK